jgi:hypothetical protein
MDDAKRNEILTAFDSSEPHCNHYKNWVTGEFEQIVNRLASDQAYEPFARATWCWHFGSYQQFGLTPYWKNVQLHWEVIITLHSFRLNHVVFDLHWENRQMGADKFREAFSNQCASQAVDFTSTGAMLGSGVKILTQQKPILNHNFSNQIIELIPQLHVFDNPIKEALRELNMLVE